MKILCARPWAEYEKDAIAKVVKDPIFLEPGEDGTMEDLVNQADVLFEAPGIPIQLIAKSPTLKLFHVSSTGADRYVSPEMQASKVILTNSRGVHAKPVAELTVALMLALAYSMPQYGRNQVKHTWQVEEIVRIQGTTAGLLGLGAIGEDLARKCKAFDMRVIGTRRDVSTPVANVDKVYAPEDTDEVLAESDFVLCSLPLTSETHYSIDYGRFCAMKPTAFFINVGRGPVVKEDDMVRALKEGRIRGAGLDVFETEPLPKESPLWDMENVVIIPHKGGSTKVNGPKVLEILVENLRRMESGRPLVNVVDKTLGY